MELNRINYHGSRDADEERYVAEEERQYSPIEPVCVETLTGNGIVNESEDNETQYSIEYDLPQYKCSLVVMISFNQDSELSYPLLYSEINDKFSEIERENESLAGRSERLRSVRRLVDEIQYKALNEFAEADLPLSEWAKSTAETAELLWAEVQKAGAGKSVCYTMPNGKELEFVPCSDDSEITIGNSVGKGNIDFYMIDDDVISSQYYITAVANKVVNHGQIEKIVENSKEKLQEFYEEKILPLQDTTIEERTAKENEDFNYFSDWHKEIYGIRPRDEASNMCYQKYMEKQSALEK